MRASVLLSLALFSAVDASPLDLTKVLRGLSSRSGDIIPIKDEHRPAQQNVQIQTAKGDLCLAPKSDDDKYRSHKRSGDDKDDKKSYVREGTQVVTVPCKDTDATWNVPKEGEAGEIQFHDGSKLVLDATRHPARGSLLYLYNSNGSPQQQFTLNKDGSITVDKFALDKGGKHGLQLWDRVEGNDNQDFIIVPVHDKGQQSTSTAAPTSQRHDDETETVYQTKTVKTTVQHPTTVTDYKTDYQTNYKTETKVVPTTVVKNETVYKTDYRTATKTDYRTETKVVPTTIVKPETVYKTDYRTETKHVPTTVVKNETVYKTDYKTETKHVPTTVTKDETVYKTNYKTDYKTETKHVPTTVVKNETKYVTKTQYETKTETKKETVTAAPQTKYETKYETKYHTEYVTQQGQGQGQQQGHDQNQGKDEHKTEEHKAYKA